MHTAQMAGIPLAERLDIAEDRTINRIFWVLFVIQVSLGLSLYVIEVPEKQSDFFDKVSPERIGTLLLPSKGEMPKRTRNVPDRAVTGSSGSGTRGRQAAAAPGGTGQKRTGGGGREKIMNKGVLSLLKGQVEGMSGVGSAAGILGNGMVEDIDAVIGELTGLKTGVTATNRRRGKAAIGYGPGSGGGIGSGTGGTLDGLLKQLGTGNGTGHLPGRRTGDVLQFITGGDAVERFSGDRDRDEIRAVVMERIGGIKHAYNKILRSNPGLQGKIAVEFVIAPSGRVVGAKVVSRTMNCPELERMIIAKIRSWRFRPAEGGNFRVTYPFVFSPGM